MKRALLGAAAVLLAAGAMFYVLISNQERATHMHFTNRGGALRNVVYYSDTPPETAALHTCDGKFADMREDLYETHLKLWLEKYGGEGPDR